jgi:exodeoxyribonuclease VII small subunit
VAALQPAGFGDLTLRLEELKARLARDGLFAAERKRPLPDRPSVVAVVTSPSGAVWHDIRTVLARRWPLATVVLAPCQVQGEAAPASIVGALERVARHTTTLRAAGRADEAPAVTILARGGGSLEDLWSFNDEAVVRAVVAHPVPVVCGVGHEVDTTLADFAADVRAATPSAAAELVVPDRAELRTSLTALGRRLDRIAVRRLDQSCAARRERRASSGWIRGVAAGRDGFQPRSRHLGLLAGVGAAASGWTDACRRSPPHRAGARSWLRRGCLWRCWTWRRRPGCGRPSDGGRRHAAGGLAARGCGCASRVGSCPRRSIRRLTRAPTRPPESESGPEPWRPSSRSRWWSSAAAWSASSSVCWSRRAWLAGPNVATRRDRRRDRARRDRETTTTARPSGDGLDDALAEFQRVVAGLETGGQPLEEALALYERGVALQAHLDRLLSDAELRIRRLVELAGGRLDTVEHREPDAGG